MFRNEMKDKLKAIFGVPKVSFDEPGESYEQDCLFVQILESQANTGQGRARAKVLGAVMMFSQKGKLPFGFFNKRIQNADKSLTKDFFFFDIDVDAQNSPARLQNISERRASFIYLYSAQYDPNQGQLTSISFE